MGQAQETVDRRTFDSAGVCPHLLGVLGSVRGPACSSLQLSLILKNHLRRAKSVKSGDRYRTNRMFRRRIYAQGFTILAVVGGSMYWETDREKRKQYDALVREKRNKEKHEAWLRELEVRDQEEQDLRKVRDNMAKELQAEKKKMQEDDKRAVEGKVKESVGQPKGGLGAVKSVLEESEDRRTRPILAAVQELWAGR